MDSIHSLSQQSNLDLNSDAFASFLDSQDPLASIRHEFHIPKSHDIKKGGLNDGEDHTPMGMLF